jgi:hypothetical protein
MKDHRWTSMVRGVLAGAMLLGLAPMALVQTATADYNYYESFEHSPSDSGEGWGASSYSTWYEGAWAWAWTDAAVWIEGEGSGNMTVSTDASAGFYFLYLWEEAGTAPGGYMTYWYDVSATLEQEHETLRYLQADLANVETAVTFSFTNYAYPLGSWMVQILGDGFNHQVRYIGPGSMILDSASWPNPPYGGLGSWHMATWDVSVDDEGPVSEGEDTIAFSLWVQVTAYSMAEADADAGIARAIAKCDIQASTDGYGWFVSN